MPFIRKKKRKKINERKTKGLIEQCARDRNFNENFIQVSPTEKEKHHEKQNIDTSF